MSVVTVIVIGLPPSITITKLAQKFDSIFDTENIGSFRVRDLDNIALSGKRQIAIDFESGFDAMLAQESLDKYTYINYVDNGHTKYILRAKIANDPAVFCQTPISPVVHHSDGELNRNTCEILNDNRSKDMLAPLSLPTHDNLESSQLVKHTSRARFPSSSRKRSRMSPSSLRSNTRARSRSRRRSIHPDLRSNTWARSRSRRRPIHPDLFKSHGSANDKSTSKDTSPSRIRSRSYRVKSDIGSSQRFNPRRRSDITTSIVDVSHIEKELSSPIQPVSSDCDKYESHRPGRSREKDLRKLIRHKENSRDSKNAYLVKIKDSARQNIMLKQKAFVEEISEMNHVTLSKEEEQSIMKHLYETVKRRINKLILTPKPNILVDDVIVCYERYFTEDDDKELIKALLKEFLIKDLNNYFENINSPESDMLEDTIDWQGVDELLKDIDMDTMINDEESQSICKIENNVDKEPENKIDVKCNEPDITQEECTMSKYPNNSWSVAQNSKYNLFRNKSVKMKKELNTQPSDTKTYEKKVFQFADKKICSNPKFVISVNNLLKEMKSIINNKYDGQMKVNKFLGIIKTKLRKKIRKLLAGKGYMNSRDITALFRIHYPVTHDEKFINHIVRDIKRGIYNDFVASDKEDIIIISDDFVASDKKDIIIISDSE